AVADIGGDRKVREQRVGLEHDAEVARRRRQARDVAALLPDAAGGLHLQAGDVAQQRGLAAARRPEEADEFAGLDVEGNVVERGECAEALAQMLDAEEGRGPHLTTSSPTWRRTAWSIPPGSARGSSPPR